jgi:acylphosphatase
LPNVVKHLVIEGRVQGVGFRYALADEARVRRLGGWVRNRRNGDVEAIVAGREEEIDAIVAWAHHGPPAAKVTSVRVELATGEFTGFDIAPTV